MRSQQAGQSLNKGSTHNLNALGMAGAFLTSF